MVEDFGAGVEQWLRQRTEGVERVDADAQSLAPLVLGQEDDEALRTADLEGIQDVVYLSHTCPGSYQSGESTAAFRLETPFL